MTSIYCQVLAEFVEASAGLHHNAQWRWVSIFLARQREYQKERKRWLRLDPAYLDSEREYQREWTRRRWLDPEYRERQLRLQRIRRAAKAVNE
jgi:hypothetical protein